jgi:hypothetical protein
MTAFGVYSPVRDGVHGEVGMFDVTRTYFSGLDM